MRYLLLLLPVVALADPGKVRIQAIDKDTNKVVNVGDDTNDAIRVNVVSSAPGGSGLTDAELRAAPVEVDGSGVTQPVSAASLPLPTGAATSAAQTDGTQRTRLTDGTNLVDVSATGGLEVDCTNCGGSTFADDDAFTGGTDTVLNGGLLYDTTPPAISDGSAGIARMNSDRVQMVDGSGYTQPVSGTVTATGPLTDAELRATPVPVSGTVTVTDGAGALNVIVDSSATVTVTDGAGAMNVIVDSSALPTGAATAAKQPALGTAGTASADVITVQGIASMTALVVDGSGVTQPVSGTVTVTDGAGALNVIVDSITAGNNNIGDVDVLSEPDVAAIGAAPPASANYIAGKGAGATGGLLTGLTVCDSHVVIDQAAASSTLLVTGVSGRHVRICSVNIVSAAANNVALISGTGATCGTSTAGVNGGATAAEGWNFAANGGLTMGSGLGEIMRTTDTGDSLCILPSAADQLSGSISYTIY